MENVFQQIENSFYVLNIVYIYFHYWRFFHKVVYCNHIKEIHSIDTHPSECIDVHTYQDMRDSRNE